jgi:hypothetical protein
MGEQAHLKENLELAYGPDYHWVLTDITTEFITLYLGVVFR